MLGRIYKSELRESLHPENVEMNLFILLIISHLYTSKAVRRLRPSPAVILRSASSPTPKGPPRLPTPSIPQFTPRSNGVSLVFPLTPWHPIRIGSPPPLTLLAPPWSRPRASPPCSSSASTSEPGKGYSPPSKLLRGLVANAHLVI